MDLPLSLAIGCFTIYLMLIAGDWITDGGAPKALALPENEGGFAKILRTGVLPHSRARDEDIRAHVMEARGRSAVARRWPVYVLDYLCATGAVAVAVMYRSPVALLAAVGWAAYPLAAKRKNRSILERYDRIEAALDRRRRDGPPPVATTPPPDLGRPHRGDLSPGRRRSGTGPTTT